MSTWIITSGIEVSISEHSLFTLSPHQFSNKPCSSLGQVGSSHTCSQYVMFSISELKGPKAAEAFDLHSAV